MAKTTKKTEKKVLRSKKYLEKAELVEKTKRYPVMEAVKLAKEASFSKFDGTIETHINTSQKGLRGLVTLPFSQGKKLRILAFGKDADKSGADIIGTDEVIEEINKGKINFDILVTTPEWMPKLAKVARILGPRSLMPNPRAGTITENLAKTVAELQGGKSEYKTEANGQVIHLAIGKVTQNEEEIVANIKALFNTIGKSRIKQITLAPTMGPGVKVDLGSL